MTDDYEFFDNLVVPLLESLTLRKIRLRNRPKQRKIEVLFSNKQFFELLNKKGFPIGKKGTKLEIPDSFSDSEMIYLISGYFATDGSLVLANNNGIIYPRIEFSSISKQLLCQVLDYLRGIGMNGNVYTRSVYDNPNWNTLYRLQFNGKSNLEIFREVIGFCNPKQERKYIKYKKENNAADGI